MLLEKRSVLLILIISNIYLSQSNYVATKFLVEFFTEKNVMVTAHLCWNWNDITALFKAVSYENSFKLTTIYTNSTKIENFLGYLATNNFFVLDLHNCNKSWHILEQVNLSGLFRYPLKWLLLTPLSDFTLLSKHLKTYSIFPTSHVIVAKGIEDSYELLQPYRIDNTQDIIWEDYGCWSKTNGLKERLHYLPTAQRRSNLQQTVMNVSVVLRNEDTWNHLEDFRYLSLDMFIKQNWMAIKSMLEYCNISYNLLQATEFGYLNKTSGRWSGVVGDLLYGRAQLSGAAVLINHGRIQAVDFLVMVNPSQIRFVLRKPPLSYMANIFFLPFYWTVWIAIVIALSLFGLALYVILNWEAKYKKKINFQDHFGINDILLITFETLCQQGIINEPRSIAARTITLIYLMGFMFLYVAYSANVVALLQSTTEISSLEQLLNSRVAVGAENVYYMKYYLTAAKDRVRQELYRKKIGLSGFYPLEEGLEKVRKGFFALHMELGSGYYRVLQKFTDYEVCSLQELEGYVQSTGGHVCVPKNSPYKEIIKVAQLKVEEYGIRRRNYNRVFKRPKCYSKGASFDSVGIMDVYPAILLWVYGIVTALLIFSVERLLQKIKRKKVPIADAYSFKRKKSCEILWVDQEKGDEINSMSEQAKRPKPCQKKKNQEESF